MAAKLNRQLVADVIAAINSTNRRRADAGTRPLSDNVAAYREHGLSPYRFRVDLRRCVLSSAWLRELQDHTPDLTDANLDTAMRAAIRETFPESVRDWATSQPLRR